AQAEQLLLTQTWPFVQSVVAARQLPVVQPLDRQIWPLPHWLSVVQAAQLLLRQTWPLLQLLLLWQLPFTHRPLAQTWLAVQTWPPVHSLLSWQVPITQLLETQM